MEKRGGVGKREARLEFKLQLILYFYPLSRKEQAEA
jgi:hypothetical protein